MLALLALEVLALLVLGAAGPVSIGGDPNRDGYLFDVVGTLAHQARVCLRPEPDELLALPAWLEQVAASGEASLPPQYPGDSAAARPVPGRPLFVLSPKGIALARVPTQTGGPNDVGQSYVPPDDASREVLELTLNGAPPGSRLYSQDVDGNYSLVVPVVGEIGSQTTAGIVLVTIEPPPFDWGLLLPEVVRMAPTAVWVVALTAVALPLAVAPLGVVLCLGW